MPKNISKAKVLSTPPKRRILTVEIELEANKKGQNRIEMKSTGMSTKDMGMCVLEITAQLVKTLEENVGIVEASQFAMVTSLAMHDFAEEYLAKNKTKIGKEIENKIGGYIKKNS